MSGNDESSKRVNLRPITDPIGLAILWLIEDEEIKPYVERVFPYASNGSGEPTHVPEYGDDFLDAFERKSKFYGPVVVLAIVLIVAIDITLCGDLPDPVLGMVLDGIGALILARGLAKGQYALAASPGRMNTAEAIDIGRVNDSVNAAWGISVFVLGIVLMIGAILGVAVPVYA